ncbi:helix-turn-helix transcriptional regulator [Priestia flexa]|uniref:helix-turn-helix transcriptional regulator n=1 Tax=Priestia flexa TaxID=86664 RepID=UPI003D2C9094
MLESKVKVKIVEKGLKQKYLAKKMGVSTQTLSAWATGRIIPPLESAFKLADILDCEISDLWEYKKE